MGNATSEEAVVPADGVFSDESIRLLCKHTYFDMDELETIKEHFLTATGGEAILKQSMFQKLYPELDQLATAQSQTESDVDEDDMSFYDPVSELDRSSMDAGQAATGASTTGASTTSATSAASATSASSAADNTGGSTAPCVQGRKESLAERMGTVPGALRKQKPRQNSMMSGFLPYLLQEGKLSLSKSLFRAFDKDGDGFITFEEYVKALSVMCRGTPMERCRVAFDILDVNGDGVLEYKEALLVAQTLEHQITMQQGSSDSSATEVLQNLFVVAVERDPKTGRLRIRADSDVDLEARKRGSKWTEGAQHKRVQRIDKQCFVDRAGEDPDIRRMFGFFRYLEQTALEPTLVGLQQKGLARSWTRMMNQSQAMSGWVVKHNRSVMGGTRKRWLQIRGGFMWYAKKKDAPVRNMWPLQYASAFTESPEALEFEVVADDFRIGFEAEDLHSKVEWIAAVRNNARDCNSPSTTPTRYDSFAGRRRGIGVQFFVLGEEYYPAIYDEIENATERIMIAGWWLVPHVPLIREVGKPRVTLMDALLSAAKRGVQIYVLTWQETEIAGMGLDSHRYAQEMAEAHKNIHTVTHPHTTPLVWSHHQKIVVIDDDTAYLGGIDLCYMRYETKEYRLTDPSPDFDAQQFPGRDYGNLCITAARKGDPRGDQIDRTEQPRMPWHDVHMSVNGLAARDVAYNFVQRWNHAVMTTSGVEADQITPCARAQAAGVGSCRVQITRSVTHWSAGVPTENSIYKAYVDSINKAKHFIFIENQYFISSTFSDRPKNRIALALYERIKLAIVNKEKFRVYVMIPLYPAGNLVDIATRYVVKWVYKTINRRKTSIFHLLGRDFPDANLTDYIQFFSLRTVERLGENYVTEQVYIHSKLMIVDDEIAILGSANINDRSMKGSRDSEIAAIVEDSTKVDSPMGGKTVKVSESVRALRIKLWRYHLGLKDSEPDSIIEDPISDQTHGLWLHIAESNAGLYEEMFEGLVESAKTLLDYSTIPSLSSTLKTERVEDLKSMIKGNLILFPFGALEEEDNSPGMTDAEWFVNKDTFL